MASDYIILLLGKSGTGKSTIANLAKKKYKLKVLNSYTTRPKRSPNEKGHRFVTDEEFEKLKKDMCAYTEFDGYKYCATNRQVRSSDIYIIDAAGLEYFKEHYKGKKQIISVELLAHKKTRYKRMRERGDSFWAARRRLRHDKKAFKSVNTTITVNANIDDPEKVLDKMMSSVNLYKGVYEANLPHFEMLAVDIAKKENLNDSNADS